MLALGTGTGVYWFRGGGAGGGQGYSVIVELMGKCIFPQTGILTLLTLMLRASSIITPNTHVLPVPLFAWAIRSRPILPKGIACSCIGEGLSNPKWEEIKG